MESLKFYTAASSNFLEKIIETHNDSVSKKAMALGRFETLNLKTLMIHVSEIFLGLFLLSCYSPGIVAAVYVAGGCLVSLIRLLTRPLSVFLISNAIIVAVAVLSGKKGNESNAAVRSSLETKAAPEQQKVPTAAVEADTVLEANVGSEELEAEAEAEDTTEKANEGHGDQRPSEATGEEEEVGKNTVEDLSTEEFNLTVEKYIARTKSFLHKERLDDIFKVEMESNLVINVS